jgi:hypothetical protein
MGLLELKQKIHNQVENADERILSIVSSVFDNYQSDVECVETTDDHISEPIVAYDVSGKPLTLEQYNEEIDKALDDFENGRFISHEALLEEIKSWRNEI